MKPPTIAWKRRSRAAAFAFQNFKNANLERLDQGGGVLPDDRRRAVGELHLHAKRVGLRGGHDDVFGAHEVADAFVFDFGVDLVAVGVGIAVDLVENEDHRLLCFAQLAECFQLDALHVA